MKFKGFTFIELLITMSISSIIIILLIMTLNTTILSFISNQNLSEIENIEYAAEYIANEARNCIDIIPIEDFGILPTDKRKFLDFVIVSSNNNMFNRYRRNYDEPIEKKFIYSAYYLSGDSIIRVAGTFNNENKPNGVENLSGFKKLCSNISSTEGTTFHDKLNLLRIRFRAIDGVDKWNGEEISIDVYLKNESQ